MSNHLVHASRGTRARLASLALVPVLMFGALTLSPAAGAASLNVNFTATSVDFGSVTVGTSATSSIVVTNNSTVPLYLQSADTSGGSVGDYVVSPSGCAGALAVAASCSLAATFTPLHPGDRTTDVRVIMGAKNKTGHVVATALVQVELTGTGVAPSFSVSDASAGTVTVGSSNVAVATVTNTSSVPLTVHGFSLQGVVRHQYAISAVTCPTPIEPSQSCDIVVTYAPDTPGSTSVTLNVSMNVDGAPKTDIVSSQSTISGSGVRTGGFQGFVALSPENFGAVTVGTSTAGQAAVVNTSSKTVTIKKFVIGGNDAKEFALGSNTCTAPLAPLGTCSVNLTFTPSMPKLRNATLAVQVQTNKGTKVVNTTVQASLAGTGVRPTISLSAPDFGPVTIGSSTSNQVVISNTSLAPLAMRGATLSGPHLPSWSKSSTTCAGELAPGASCEVELTFAPHTAGNLSIVFNAVLTIKVGKHPVLVLGQLTVNGTGVEPSFTVVPPTLGPTDQSVAVTGVAVVTNASDVALTYKSAHIGGANPNDFTVTGTTCTAQLAPSGTCDLTVKFTPNQVGAGTRSGVLSTTMDVDGIAPVHSVSLAVALTGTES